MSSTRAMLAVWVVMAGCLHAEPEPAGGGPAELDPSVASPGPVLMGVFRAEGDPVTGAWEVVPVATGSERGSNQVGVSVFAVANGDEQVNLTNGTHFSLANCAEGVCGCVNGDVPAWVSTNCVAGQWTLRGRVILNNLTSDKILVDPSAVFEIISPSSLRFFSELPISPTCTSYAPQRTADPLLDRFYARYADVSPLGCDRGLDLWMAAATDPSQVLERVRFYIYIYVDRLDPACGDGVVGPGEQCDGDPPRGCSTPCGTVGTEECVSCQWSGTCVPPAEACNGADDDCDGEPDNGFDCVQGTIQACTIDGWPGTQTCQAETCTWGACNPDAPPTDRCNGTYAEIGGGGVFTGNTSGAADDFSGSCDGTGGKDVVYRLVLAERSRITLDTTGSAFDTVLYVRSGAACPGETEAACDDNGAGGSASRIVTTLEAGTYWVVLDGTAPAEAGAYTLTVGVTPSPANDTCAGAIDISAGGLFAGSTGAADDDNAGCAGSGGQDVWYRFTVPAATTWIVYLDTVDDQTWDSVIHVRSGGSCTGALAACADNQCGGSRSQWVGVLGPGDYYAIVDGATAAAAGKFVLRFQRSARCGATAAAISGDGTYSGTTTGAGNDTVPGCRISSAAPDVLYYFGLCATRTIAATTCSPGTGVDNVLHYRSGACANGSTEPACGTRTCATGGKASISASLGQGLHFLIVDGRGTKNFGPFSVVVSGF